MRLGVTNGCQVSVRLGVPAGVLSPCPTGARSLSSNLGSFRVKNIYCFEMAQGPSLRLQDLCSPETQLRCSLCGKRWWHLSVALCLASCGVAHFVLKVACPMETRQGVVEIVGWCLSVTYWPTEIHRGVNHKPASVHFYMVWTFCMCKKILRGMSRLSHSAINSVLKCEVGGITAVPAYKDSATGKQKWFCKPGNSVSNPNCTWCVFFGLCDWHCVFKVQLCVWYSLMISEHKVRCSQKPTWDQYSAAV